jgi:hypothetical protein
MKSVVRPELPTAAAGPSQAPAAAMDSSAPRSTDPEPTYKSGKTVQRTGTTSSSVWRVLARGVLRRRRAPSETRAKVTNGLLTGRTNDEDGLTDKHYR